MLRLRPYATFETPPRHVHDESDINPSLTHWVSASLPWDDAADPAEDGNGDDATAGYAHLVTPNSPGAAVRKNERAPPVFGAARPARRLGHLVIGTPDLAATRDLPVDGISAKVTDEVNGIIHFLRCSTDRHAWGIGRHFAGSNFYWYLRDPSGGFLELYSDLDEVDDDDAWEQRGRTPHRSRSAEGLNPVRAAASPDDDAAHTVTPERFDPS